MEGFVNLAWLVPIPPFLAFLAIILFINRNKSVSALVAIGGVVITFLLSWPIAFYAFFSDHFGEHPVEGTLFSIPTGTSAIDVGYLVDAPGALMLFMVSFLLVMIFVYSSGYMTFPHHLSAAAYPDAAAQGKDPR
jgi:NADH-quinone oxidoreductase subunit L